MNNDLTARDAPKARMEIAIYPLGTGNVSVSREVSSIFGVLDTCGLPYHITVMGTIVEGTPDELFALARTLHDVMFTESVNRVVTVIRIDEKRQPLPHEVNTGYDSTRTI